MTSTPQCIASDFEFPGLREYCQRLPQVQLTVLEPNQALPPDTVALLTLGVDSPQLRQRLTQDSSLRWIHAFRTGIDEFPLELAGTRLLSCSRGASAVPIAEWAMTMMLAAAKHLPEAWVHEPPAVWGRTALESLEGQTLALAGFGTIAQAIARRAAAFDMKLRAWVRHPRQEADSNISWAADWPSLVADADHVVLALPLTASTRGLVNASALQAMKPGAHLINVARGPLLDQEALRQALDQGHLSRASLDTMEPEPLPGGHWLYQHPLVRLSPHISWSSPKSLRAMTEMFFDNLGRFVRSERLQGLVNLAEGY